MTRLRADILLARQGYFASRERARAAILAGDVRADGEPVTKAGRLLDEGVTFTVRSHPAYVSRGGDKLEAALARFGVDVEGARAVDVGASTGGFTDCLLARGARSVAAVDVGYGQLAWELRNDPRVEVHERTNIRHVRPEDVGAPFDLAVVDVSFIGLDKVLPVVEGLVSDAGDILALVKPQFEAGRGHVGKGGVVRDPATHADVLRSVIELVEKTGWVVRGLTDSPLRGAKGNIEFWVWLSRQGVPAAASPEDVVSDAHQARGG